MVKSNRCMKIEEIMVSDTMSRKKITWEVRECCVQLNSFLRDWIGKFISVSIIPVSGIKTLVTVTEKNVQCQLFTTSIICQTVSRKLLLKCVFYQGNLIFLPQSKYISIKETWQQHCISKLQLQVENHRFDWNRCTKILSSKQFKSS